MIEIEVQGLLTGFTGIEVQQAGVQGFQGPKGDQGDVGPQGPQGLSGTADYRKLTFQSAEGGPFDDFATPYRQIVGGVFPSAVVWWTDSSMTTKILEKLIVRDGNQSPTTITQILYASDGVTVLKTAVDTLSYSGVFETSRTRVIT